MRRTARTATPGTGRRSPPRSPTSEPPRPAGPRPPRIRGRAGTLLGTQALFNVGFFAVVPFIAVVLSEDFALGGAAVGIVLGVRTFAQQGMFLLGGALADRCGARAVILLGCGVRIAGFLTLAASVQARPALLALFVVGTILTGLGGALFSPGLNVLVAEAESRRPRTGSPGRATLFAWLAVSGEIGAVVGPLLGAAMLGWGFAAVAAGGAALFTGIGVFLAWALPRRPPATGGARPVPARGAARTGTAPGAPADRAPDRPRPAARGSSWAALRDRRFLALAGFHASDLLAYNQLYLTLPLALTRSGQGPQAVGLLFAWVSVLTLALQIPVSRWSVRVGAPAALRTGYLLTAGGFVVLLLATLAGPAADAGGAGGAADGGAGGPGTAAVLGAATLLMIGHLAASPTALGLVPRFAAGGPTGSYFGLLASCGGAAVLLGNTAVGRLLDVGAARPEAAGLPWLLLAALPALSAWAVPRILRRGI
ncbi:MFS transporter [Brachybacterium phenoliresistens]|uniref:MFS transporter n=1 Tax=Brachybacterium phenoliresistens TaxID=396014 RepID=UPI0031E014A8